MPATPTIIRALRAAVEQPDDRAVPGQVHRHSERHRIAKALAERAQVPDYFQRIRVLTFLLLIAGAPRSTEVCARALDR